MEIFKTAVGPGIVFLRGGIIELREGTDTEIAFRQESRFLYLTGVNMPDFTVALEPSTGKVILFVPERDEYWAMWNGVVETLPQLREKYGIEELYYTRQQDEVLHKLAEGGKKNLSP